MSKFVDFNGVKYLWQQIVAKVQTEVDEAIQQSIVIEGNEDILRIATYGTQPYRVVDGEYYVNASDGKLYKGVNGSWVEWTPSGSILYLANDTKRVFTYSAYDGFRELLKKDELLIVNYDEDEECLEIAANTHVVYDASNEIVEFNF